jgi:putative Mg2+ transporter-C (MgtC) family protein
MWVVAATATIAGIVILWLLRKTQVAAGIKEE